jgi:hypothetical protein
LNGIRICCLPFSCSVYVLCCGALNPTVGDDGVVIVPGKECLANLIEKLRSDVKCQNSNRRPGAKAATLVLNGIRICSLPVTIPLLKLVSAVYLFVVSPLLFFSAKLMCMLLYIIFRKIGCFLQSLARMLTSSSTVELKLDFCSSGNDEWSGRELDVVRRINQHSSEKVNEMKSELASAKEGDKQIRLELATMRSEQAAMKEDMKREMAAIKEMLRRQIESGGGEK